MSGLRVWTAARAATPVTHGYSLRRDVELLPEKLSKTMQDEVHDHANSMAGDVCVTKRHMKRCPRFEDGFGSRWMDNSDTKCDRAPNCGAGLCAKLRVYSITAQQLCWGRPYDLYYAAHDAVRRALTIARN